MIIEYAFDAELHQESAKHSVGYAKALVDDIDEQHEQLLRQLSRMKVAKNKLAEMKKLDSVLSAREWCDEQQKLAVKVPVPTAVDGWMPFCNGVNEAFFKDKTAKTLFMEKMGMVPISDNVNSESYTDNSDASVGNGAAQIL